MTFDKEEPAQSKLIDFDLGGVEGIHSYPDGYNLAITDGKRHDDACGGV